MRALLLLLLAASPIAVAVPIPFSNTDAFTYEGVATPESHDVEEDWMNGITCGRDNGWWQETWTLEVLAGTPADALRLTIESSQGSATALARPNAPAGLSQVIWACDIPTFAVDGESVTAAVPYRATLTSAFVAGP